MPDACEQSAADWEEFFAFEEPYENQADAIETALDVGERRGFLAMEGPCGTGKTMAALTAGATLVRGSSQYERILVVTPVKQQLRQFVDDLRAMNRGLDDPLDGVALVGKRDLCPYAREDVFPREVSTHERCEDLRESTANLVRDDGDQQTFDGQDADELSKLRPDGALDEAWWDPVQGRELARHARRDSDARITDDGLDTADAESPYVRHQPTAPDELSGQGETLYCPFEADWYGRNKGSPIDFSAGEDGVVTVSELLPASVERGTCPHRVQSVLLDAADVIIGNYNHLFDPNSRPLLDGLLDEQTFVVVDEAHRMEERVRDLLSDRVGRQSLVRAANDFGQLLQAARQSEDNREEIAERLQSYGASLDAVEDAREFLDALADWVDERTAEFLRTEFGTTDPRDLPERDLEVPLRDPERTEPDELTRWAEREGYTGDVWRSLATVGTAVSNTLDDAEGEETDRQTVCGPVGITLTRWWERDHAGYFRELELEYSGGVSGETHPDHPWRAAYAPGLLMYNCMPGDRIGDILGELGGGVLMSATLEPIDVFEEVVGLDRLADGDDGTEEEVPRPVEERTYDLPFPEENRASFTVDATAYTRHNRGGVDEDTRTRDEYRHVLRTVARTPGNILVCMPNYREAEWAADYLEDVVDKPVLVDESSSDEDTEDLKQSFFAGGEKVLVTSTRGTLTEGVDYDGDKLAACAVVGVPLVNVGSPRVRAVRRAYADAFGEENAFEYALTVPAVRRARQAIGRVIRGEDEVGVRVFVGNRYVEGARHSVHEYLAPEEQAEFVRMTPEFLGPQLEAFWADH
ncbi:ATP-dependent DNA helicase [Halospeciosus flavus]|uniref:ATP-dependent DNA helicase n=1 Tax=Halospeciosus flavus TaxID=3032283 RepID=A0ABD5Z287_9EURY|nr:ATP-dependent DNA helicase [Halospeciosus flavus]